MKDFERNKWKKASTELVHLDFFLTETFWELNSKGSIPRMRDNMLEFYVPLCTWCSRYTRIR